jgi:hypothetical protein
MSDDLRQQIYDNFNQKETEELFEIWQANNRKDWSDSAFEVLRQILQERLDQPPAQQEVVNKAFEEDLDDVLDEENWPGFYDPENVILLDRWLNRAAIAAVVVTAILNLLQISDLHDTVSAIFNNQIWHLLAWPISLLWACLNIAIEFIVVYIPLKALAYILKILMEMEFDSRGARVTLQEINEVMFGNLE